MKFHLSCLSEPILGGGERKFGFSGRESGGEEESGREGVPGNFLK